MTDRNTSSSTATMSGNQHVLQLVAPIMVRPYAVEAPAIIAPSSRAPPRLLLILVTSPQAFQAARIETNVVEQQTDQYEK